jgi:hypothetical protein
LSEEKQTWKNFTSKSDKTIRPDGERCQFKKDLVSEHSNFATLSPIKLEKKISNANHRDEKIEKKWAVGGRIMCRFASRANRKKKKKARNCHVSRCKKIISIENPFTPRKHHCLKYQYPQYYKEANFRASIRKFVSTTSEKNKTNTREKEKEKKKKKKKKKKEREREREREKRTRDVQNFTSALKKKHPRSIDNEKQQPDSNYSDGGVRE